MCEVDWRWLVESQTQKATQLPGVSRQQLAARPAKRAPTAIAIAGRLDDKRDVLGGYIVVARTCIPCRAVVSSASALWNPGEVLGRMKCLRS